MDKSSLIGVVLAVGGILAGLLLEGGNIRQILQPTAAMIVLGGTLGAVMLQFPLPVVLQAMRRLVPFLSAPSKIPGRLFAVLCNLLRKRARKALCRSTPNCPRSTTLS